MDSLYIRILRPLSVVKVFNYSLLVIGRYSTSNERINLPYHQRIDLYLDATTVPETTTKENSIP